DDVDLAAGAEDVGGHLRVPVAGLVAEMNAGFQHLAHGDLGHCCDSDMESAARKGEGGRPPRGRAVDSGGGPPRPLPWPNFLAEAPRHGWWRSGVYSTVTPVVGGTTGQL